MSSTSTTLTLTTDPKGPSQFTKAANDALLRELTFADKDDFTDATHGFLRTWPEIAISSQANKADVIWTLDPFKDQELHAPCPDTVNPSLWRQSKLNRTNGLYEVAPGFYQVRAFDLSNMTIIEGKKGLIIIDPLISCECAADALKLYREQREAQGSGRDVVAVIFTHSHVDHFGGVLGVVTPQDVKNGVQVIAPEGFLEHAVSENVYAGAAMGRRAQYMYGPYLKANHQGLVDAGLGKGQSIGKVSIVAPTLSVTRTGQTVTIDGVDIVFHMTPGAEAPAEFDFYFPQSRLFCAAENAAHTMHNIQTLRGARVRDALLWSKYLNEALALFGHETDVLFASHHWPIWDKRADMIGRVARSLTTQRDMYRYLNDQTLRMLNKGYTGVEIAEVFEMPPALAKDWSCRGYYGSVNHNVKAVYDRYMGWFDGNPSHLHPLPPAESAPRYVDAMGGPAQVMAKARAAFEAGDYRWAAELLDKLVFADQNNQDAKLLLADTLEQLGYQAEAATWRNFYLMGAQELRHGLSVHREASQDASMIAAMTTEMIFDAIAGRIVGPAANAVSIVMNWIFTDTQERYLVELSNGALSTMAGKTSMRDDVTIVLTRDALNRVMAGALSPQDAIEAGDIKVHGDITKFGELFKMIDRSEKNFPIVTPRSSSLDAWWPKPKVQPQEGLVAALQDKVQALDPLPRGC